MNKILRIMLIFVLAIAVLIGGWFLYMLYGPKVAIEEILPSDAVVYARLVKPADQWQKIGQTDFWKNVSAIDVPKVLVRNKFPVKGIAQYKHWQNQGMEFLSNPLAQKFLDQEIAAVVYHREKTGANLEAQDDYEALVVLRLAPLVQVAELATHLLKFGKEVNITEEDYQGKHIVHVRFKDVRFKYVRLNDLLVMSQDLPTEQKLKSIIDVFAHRRPSLKTDGKFAFVQSYVYPGAQGLVYVNPAVKMAGFNAYALSFVSGSITKYKFIVGFDAQAMNPSLRRVFVCSPKENSSMGIVPSNAMGYYWSGCSDFKEYWQQINEHLYMLPELGSQVKKIKHVLEKRSGVNFDQDILPIFGEEAGGYLTDIDTLGVFPYPRLLFFVKVKDAIKSEEMFGKFIKSPIGMIQHEEYNQAKIHFLPLPLGANMDPGYCFVGDYLLASTSRQLLKKSIDSFTNPVRSLGSERILQTFKYEPKQKTQGFMFLKVGETAKLVHGLLEWSDKYLLSQINADSAYRQESAEKKKELAQDIAEKGADLKLALGKLQELRTKSMLADLAVDEHVAVMDAITSLERDVQGMRDDIRTDIVQRRQIDSMAHNYAVRTDSAKLFMYNSRQVLIPIVKGLESANAHATKIVISDKVLETELMFN